MARRFWCRWRTWPTVRADQIAGRSTRLTPSPGTAIVKVFDLTVAVTGWKREAGPRGQSAPPSPVHSHPTSRAGCYPGVSLMAFKLLIDPVDGTITGAQEVGGEGWTSAST